MQLTPEEESLEQSNGELLAAIGNVDSQTARKVLRKHKGDMEKAADALLAGDRGEASVWESQHRTTPEPMYTDSRSTGKSTSTAIAPHPSSSVIDLTGDGEDDINRAIQMSMQDDNSRPSAPKFGPSERAPHPEWQMVRSNAPVAGDSSSSVHDRILDDVIQASLQDFNKEEDDLAPLPPAVREGGRPIALRPSVPAFAYAALVLQAMYYVPQIRSAVSNLRLPSINTDIPVGSVERAMWNLIELFTNMDLAQLSFMVDIELIPSLETHPLHGNESLSEASAGAVRNLNELIEDHMRTQAVEGEEPDRLFTFTHGRVTLSSSIMAPAKVDRNPEPASVVVVAFGGGNPHNDLVSCMEHILQKKVNDTLHYDVIVTPSDVIGFQLNRIPSSSKSSPDPFVYPKTIFLDRFLFHNFALTTQKRALEQEMRKEIWDLTQHKGKLTRFGARDTLQDLRSTIHYYEHVADRGDDPERQRTLERTANHLKDILTMILGKVEDIDHRVEKLQAEVASIYDCPELRQYQYDLRAVLMHTGLPGRKQMYSYVQDAEGTWWKTVDHEVTEVPEETVLTDPTGLHLGAGPYMLLYSRHLSEEQIREPLVWPTIFSEAVQENNKKFLAMVHPELGIFSNPNSTTENTPVPELATAPAPPTSARELPVPGGARPMSRQSSMRSNTRMD